MKENSLSTPFSIHARARPKRIALLIDPKNSPQELLDAIWEFNLWHWGGRYNPIIPVVRKEISDSYWKLLEFSDPDIIYSYVKLPKSLVERIDKRVAPYYFKNHKTREPETNRVPFLPTSQLDIKYLTPKAIISHSSPIDNFGPYFLVTLSPKTWRYYRFLNRNFGVYNFTLFGNKLPSRTNKLVIHKTDGPVEIFQKIGKAPREVVFPIQLCEFGTEFNEIEKSFKHDQFCILIGENIWNWIYFWNRIFILPSYKRRELSQICIPTDFIDSSDILDSLKHLLASKLVYRTGQNSPRVLFASHELKKKDLEKIGKEFAKDVDMVPVALPLKSNVFPPVDKKNIEFESLSSTSHSHVIGPEVFISAQRPDFLPISEPSPTCLAKIANISFGMTWMVDFKIEYRPELFSYTNVKYFWKLPKRGLEPASLFTRYRPSRITNDGLISVEVNENDKNIQLFIPEDWQVIHACIIKNTRYNRYYKDDSRDPKKKASYKNFSISDKGRYTKGFLELFPNPWGASQFIETRYWRKILEFMCQRSSEEEGSKLEPIKNWIQKNIVTSSKLDKEQLSRFIFKKIYELKSIIPEVDFNFLLEKFQEEVKEYVSKNPKYKRPKKGIVRELVETLGELTNRTFFLQGVKVKCETCGSNFWYGIEELQRIVKCRGCRSKIPFPVEVRWSYRLNDLVKNAVSFHGVLPVIWGLGHILSRSRESFIYLPGIDLYDYRSKGSVSEVDIVSISDGELILAEIVSSGKEFTDHKIEKFARICKKILPEKAILGAFKQTITLKDAATKLSQILEPFDINVESINPNSYVFEPTYRL
ncbi:hypothetical protein KAW65_09425 [candidate division WOR-3 bacterium]|nr:hypothetical protein [candidate division WOR-3 bacterium]